MDLAAYRADQLDYFSDEFESDNRPELCILVGDHINRGGGRLKLELQHHIWFDESVVTRVAVSRCLLPCIPLELLARWDVNFLLASFLMHYEPFSGDVTETLVENLKIGLLHPFECRLRALQRWQLVTARGDLTEHFKRGIENCVLRREIICTTCESKMALLDAVDHLQLLHERLKQDIEGVKRALRNYCSECDDYNSALTRIIGF
jgi:hypothetical protein